MKVQEFHDLKNFGNVQSSLILDGSFGLNVDADDASSQMTREGWLNIKHMVRLLTSGLTAWVAVHGIGIFQRLYIVNVLNLGEFHDVQRCGKCCDCI